MEKVEVSIGARIDELISEMQKAATSVSTSADRIANNVGRSMAQVENSANDATRAIQRTQREAAEGASGIGHAMEGLRGMVGGALAGMVAGFSVKMVTDQVMQFADRAERLQNVAQIVGTTATAISRLHAVAAPLSISSDQVDTGMKKLAKTLVDAQRGGEESAAAFHAVGVSAKELQGLTLTQALDKIADKFHDTEDGAGKAALAQMLLGKSGAELIPLLNQGSEEMRAQADAAERMGAAMGEDAVQAGADLDNALDELNMRSAGFVNMMSQELAPALQYIVEAFTDDSNAALDFGSVFRGVATVVIAAVTVIQNAWNIVSSIVRGITVAIASVFEAIGKAASGDFSGARASLALGREMIAEELSGMIERTDELATKFREKMGSMWGDGGSASAGAAAAEGPKGQIAFGDKGKGSGGGEAEKKAAAEAKAAAKEKFDYEMELLKNQMAELERGSAQKLIIARQETALVVAQYGEQSNEYLRSKERERQIAKEVEAEKLRIQDAALGAAQQRAAHEIEIERGKGAMLLATGRINAVERAQMEIALENEAYALKLSYLEQRLALYAMEKAEVEKINAEILALKQGHELQMQQLDVQHFESSKAGWDSYFSVINDAFANSIQGMVFQGTTLREAWGSIMQSILGSLIQTGVKMATNWASTQLGMTSATVTGAAVRTAAEVSSAKASTAANAGAAIKNIMTKAVEVFANVYNAIAGIPYVGPFLAPVMAVAAGATVVGLVGKVASAEGGWDRVPYDGAQAILHKEEMVLPAPLAEGIRAMVEGGQRGGGGVTIQAMDRRDVERYFNDNSDIYMRTLAMAQANNPGGL